MGQDKAEVMVAGRPMISWVVAALAAVADRVFVAGRAGGWDGHPGLPDPTGLAGPLAGLAAGLRLGTAGSSGGGRSALGQVGHTVEAGGDSGDGCAGTCRDAAR